MQFAALVKGKNATGCVLSKNDADYTFRSRPDTAIVHYSFSFKVMTMTIRPFPAAIFRPIPFILCLSLGVLWIAAWLEYATFRAWFDRVDSAVFFTLNGAMASRPWLMNTIAVGNSHWMDIIMGCTVVAVFYCFARADHAQQVMPRLCTFFVPMLMTVGAKLILRHFETLERHSASLVLEPAYHLSDYVDWIVAKDISYDSFPSDHGSLLLISVICMWFYGGRRFGLPMTFIGLLFCQPRLFSGAHWFSDMAVGSVAVALMASAIILCTPLHGVILNFFVRLFDRPLFTRLLPMVGLGPKSPRTGY